MIAQEASNCGRASGRCFRGATRARGHPRGGRLAALRHHRPLQTGASATAARDRHRREGATCSRGGAGIVLPHSASVGLAERASVADDAPGGCASGPSRCGRPTCRKPTDCCRAPAGSRSTSGASRRPRVPPSSSAHAAGRDPQTRPSRAHRRDCGVARRPEPPSGLLPKWTFRVRVDGFRHYADADAAERVRRRRPARQGRQRAVLARWQIKADSDGAKVEGAARVWAAW